MKKLVLASVIFALSTAVSAQFVSPVQMNGKEGNSYAYYGPGMYADGHYQLAEGSINQSQVIRRLGFRLDGTLNYGTSTGPGRSWSNVRIEAGDTDTSKLTVTFSTNFIAKTTVVFNSAFKWPNKTSGTAGSTPAKWDNAYSYLFTSVVLANGKNQLLFDFQTTGGKLTNGAAWGTTTARTYYFDAIRETTTTNIGVNTSTPTFHPSRSSLTCGDPNASLAAFTQGEIKVHNNYSANGANRNMTVGTIAGVGMDPGKAVIQVADPIGSAKGVNLGFACNNLHVGMSPVALVFPTKAINFGTGYAESIVKLPNNVAFTGIKIWTQSAWVHSKLQQLAVTGSSVTSVPSIPPDIPDRAALFQSNRTSTTGVNVYAYPTYYYYLPGAKYDAK